MWLFIFTRTTSIPVIWILNVIVKQADEIPNTNRCLEMQTAFRWRSMHMELLYKLVYSCGNQWHPIWTNWHSKLVPTEKSTCVQWKNFVELIKIRFISLRIFFHRVRVCNCGHFALHMRPLDRMVIWNWIDQWGVWKPHRNIHVSSASDSTQFIYR